MLKKYLLFIAILGAIDPINNLYAMQQGTPYKKSRKEREIEELAKRIDDYFHNWEEKYSFDRPAEQIAPQNPVEQPKPRRALERLHRLDDFARANKGQYDWNFTKPAPTVSELKDILNTLKRETPQETFDRELRQYQETQEEQRAQKIEELAKRIDAYFDNWEERYSFDLPAEQRTSQKPVEPTRVRPEKRTFPRLFYYPYAHYGQPQGNGLNLPYMPYTYPYKPFWR